MSDLERRLQDKTLQVYLYLLKKKEPSGIREIQRDLSLSSPSVAEYQVDKLVRLGIASKDSYGRVRLVRKVRVKALDSYVNFGRFTVPRLAFYATLFSAIAPLYALIAGPSLYGVAVPAAAAGLFWFETWKVWRYSLLERAARPGQSEAQGSSMWPSLAPGIVALAVFAAAGVFLFYYVVPAHPAGISVGTGDYGIPAASSNGPTSDESAEISRQKVLAAGGGAAMLPDFASTLLLFAAAAVVGFVGYVMFRCRCCPDVRTGQPIAVRNAGLSAARCK
ncbi:MAG: hypothetical protein ABI347_08320 [Nitrososphaera sp.]|jgi:hypothetical protein